VRTTLTLDEDVAAKLKAESRKTGRPFRDTVNSCLRAGLSVQKQSAAARPFRVKAHDMGLRPGINIDKVSAMLDELEGPEHR
jgi:hypothetical protein